MKGRVAKYGREPDDLKILPAFCPVVGGTRAEAQAKLDDCSSWSTRWPVSVRSTARLAIFPVIRSMVRCRTMRSVSSGVRSISAQLRERVKQREADDPRIIPALRHHRLARIGTPADIADAMQEWFENGACDGFNITPTHLPGGCEDFVELVVPELQRGGLFRAD